jgi:hypothetical protein
MATSGVVFNLRLSQKRSCDNDGSLGASPSGPKKSRLEKRAGDEDAQYGGAADDAWMHVPSVVGDNEFFTNPSPRAGARIAAADTAILAEGANLYYTEHAGTQNYTEHAGAQNYTEHAGAQNYTEHAGAADARITAAALMDEGDFASDSATHFGEYPTWSAPVPGSSESSFESALSMNDDESFTDIESAESWTGSSSDFSSESDYDSDTSGTEIDFESSLQGATKAQRRAGQHAYQHAQADYDSDACDTEIDFESLPEPLVSEAVARDYPLPVAQVLSSARTGRRLHGVYSKVLCSV